ncbi:hypothetical protein [Bradyrhizobium sp. DOA1]|uniref:hypothetical protein n=1 Tax=Bradyrhizobium sp. DOA1 TaxID=1126616 RepID=UPI000AE2DD6D
MKVVILAGGLAPGFPRRPAQSPLIGIDGRPILWHIMKIYSHRASGLRDVPCYKAQ